MNKVYLYLLAGGAALILLASVLWGLINNPDAAYVEAILKYRTEKNKFMLGSPQSPLELKSAFKGLAYFAPDPNYKVVAPLKILSDTSVYLMRMTDKGSERFRKFGFVTFVLGTDSCRLCLYQYLNAGGSHNKLFVPFADLSNGKETYAGGRYLDIEMPAADQTVVLDFNLAYNPFCVYNHHFVCPVPPAENRLKVRIPVGEMVYSE